MSATQERATINGFPTDLRYSPEGIWVRISEGIATVGLTPELSADEEIYYIELPHLGAIIANDEVGIIETAKSSISFESPVTGTVVEVNEDAEADPEGIAHNPYETWLYRVKLAVGAEPAKAINSLLSAADYVKQLECLVS